MTDYVYSLITFLVGIAIILVFKNIVLGRLKAWAKRTSTDIDDFLVINIRKLLPPFYYSAFYLGIRRLELGSGFVNILRIASLIIITVFSVRFVLSLIAFSLESSHSKKKPDIAGKHAVKGMLTVIRLIVWSFALIILLDNLGVEITALVTGLGIGGIAIALAAQAVLGDLFSYFTIFFDRPFEIGDFIIIGEYQGTVEHIGIKTSRIRSLSGEELVFSNTDITNSRLKNYRRMKRRRVAFQIGVTYDTTVEQLKAIPGIIQKIIGSINETTFDRCHFFSFGDFSQDIETVYFVEDRDYTKYMNAQQEINLRIREEFDSRGIEFAFPTQSLYIKNPDTSI